MEPDTIGMARIWIRGKKGKHIVIFRRDGEIYFNLMEQYYPGGDEEWKRLYYELEDKRLPLEKRIEEISQGTCLKDDLHALGEPQLEILLGIILKYSVTRN